MQVAEAAPRIARVVDERGRLIPMTEAEVKARAPMIARELAALDEMGDEEEQLATLEALIAAGVGSRSLFLGEPS